MFIINIKINTISIFFNIHNSLLNDDDVKKFKNFFGEFN